MTTLPPTAANPSRSRARRVVAVAAIAAGAALLALLLWRAWLWRTAPVPPTVRLTEDDARLRRAVDAARAEVLARPRSAESWGDFGSLLLAHGYDEEAGACFAQAERLDPADRRWPYLWAAGLLRTDPDGAMPHLRRAAELCAARDDEYSRAARLQLAEALLTAGRLDEAQPLFREALEKDPDSPRAHLGMGQMALARGDTDEALAHLARCTSSPYTARRACVQIAGLRRRRGEAEAAAELASRAERLPQDRPWDDPFLKDCMRLAVGRQAVFTQAERMEHSGRLPDAAVLLRDLVETYPDDTHSAVKLGVVLVEMGDFAEGERVLRNAVARAPDQFQAHYFLAVAVYNQAERQEAVQPGAAAGRFEEAADSARKAAALKPDHAFAHLYRGLALRHLGRRGEAVESLRAAVRCGPELSDPHLHLGEALAEEGRKDEARAELTRAAELAPDDPRPREALARLRAGQ
ncbi:MAG TPA: tetratricopeptide repeat protein [Gemmataceae bacterium]|nr:tetratricopeptide repeat protein [Gemmataceae bacterium]